MTYGRPVSAKGINFFNKLPHKNIVFTACSNYCVSTGNVAGRWETVYNAIDFSKYQLRDNVASDSPLMFLGRLDKIKGVHTAIKVARATGSKLIIGGNIPHTADNLKYYREEVEPQINGEQIVYLGALNDEEKNRYLGQAKALLFPIAWDEPFGMVMAEAMACGTPVIAFKRGAVPEVISEDITGFIVANEEEMIEKIAQTPAVDRMNCRRHAKERFDAAVIAERYLSLFDNYA